MTNNVIIFEGQDRCLKSTMINRLIQTDSTHHYHTLHYGKPPKIAEVEKYQQRTYQEMFDLLNSSKDFILDRSHLGEMIWAPIYRNYDSLPFIQSQEQKWYKENKSEKNIFLFVLVDSNYTTWSSRDDLQGLNDGKEDKHLLEIERFKNSLSLTCIESKHFIDLKYWYKEDSTRIDDDALFNHIYSVISES